MAITERTVAYGHGYLSPGFLAVHSTGNPGATAANHASYWGNNPDYAVHLVSDWNECLHTVPYDRLCWQVGNGNALCEGIEICEATNQADFERGMAVARAAILERLKAHGWTVDGNVRSHLWFTQNYGGSDHTDPIPYLNRFGWSWDRFVNYIKEGDDEVTPEDIDKIVHGVWEYNWEGTAPQGNTYNALVSVANTLIPYMGWQYCNKDVNPDQDTYGMLTDTLRGVRELQATVAALSETVKTLAEAQGADPEEIAKTVSEAVAKKLESIDLSVTVGE